MASPLRLWDLWGRGRVLPSVRASPDRSCVVASLRMGEGAVGPAASPLARVGVGSLRPCPLRDMPEVSGDQDTLSRVQGAAQGVVSGGYLGLPVRGTARKLVSRLPGTQRGSWRGFWTACLRPPLSPAPAVVSGDHRVGGGGRGLECLAGGGLGLQPQLGALEIGWPPPCLPSPWLLANCSWLKGLPRRGPGINHQLCPEYRAIALMAPRDRGRTWGRSLWLSLPLGQRERALRPDLQKRLPQPKGPKGPRMNVPSRAHRTQGTVR